MQKNAQSQCLADGIYGGKIVYRQPVDALFSGTTVVALVNTITSLFSLYDRYLEYAKLKEQEITKRQQIEAEKEATIAKIRQTQEFVIGYLNHAFDERARNFRQLFERIDGAIERGDNTQLAMLLGTLVKYAQTSPFTQLADLAKVKGYLKDSSHVWEL